MMPKELLPVMSRIVEHLHPEIGKISEEEQETIYKQLVEQFKEPEVEHVPKKIL